MSQITSRLCRHRQQQVRLGWWRGDKDDDEVREVWGGRVMAR
jgi:hypothetical protein